MSRPTKKHSKEDELGAGDGQLPTQVTETANQHDEEHPNAINPGRSFGDVPAEFSRPQGLLPYHTQTGNAPTKEKRQQPPRSPADASLDLRPSSSTSSRLSKGDKDRMNLGIKKAPPRKLGNTTPKSTKNKANAKITATQRKQAQAAKKKTFVKDAIKASIRKERAAAKEPNSPRLSPLFTRKAKVAAAEHIKAQLAAEPRRRSRVRKPATAGKPKGDAAAFTPIQTRRAPRAAVSVGSAVPRRRSRRTNLKNRELPAFSRADIMGRRRNRNVMRSAQRSAYRARPGTSEDSIAARVIARRRRRNGSSLPASIARRRPGRPRKLQLIIDACAAGMTVATQTSCHILIKTVPPPVAARESVATQTSSHTIVPNPQPKPTGRVTKAKNRQDETGKGKGPKRK